MQDKIDELKAKCIELEKQMQQCATPEESRVLTEKYYELQYELFLLLKKRHDEEIRIHRW